MSAFTTGTVFGAVVSSMLPLSAGLGLGSQEETEEVSEDGADEAVCEVLAMNASAPGTPPLKAHFEEIEAAYEREDLTAILAALEAGSPWAREQAAQIRRGCPVSAVVAHRLLKEPAADIEEALIQEFRATCFCAARPDFAEGVKAALVEKRPPVWSPSRLEQVTEAHVAGAFRPPEGGDLSF